MFRKCRGLFFHFVVKYRGRKNVLKHFPLHYKFTL